MGMRAITRMLRSMVDLITPRHRTRHYPWRKHQHRPITFFLQGKHNASFIYTLFISVWPCHKGVYWYKNAYSLYCIPPTVGADHQHQAEHEAHGAYDPRYLQPRMHFHVICDANIEPCLCSSVGGVRFGTNVSDYLSNLLVIPSCFSIRNPLCLRFVICNPACVLRFATPSVIFDYIDQAIYRPCVFLILEEPNI